MPNQVKESNNLAAVAAIQSEQLRNTAALAIDEIQLGLIETTPNAVVPEWVFVEYFLDFFMQPAKHVDSPLLSKWIELSGGPYREVDIINKEGVIIFTVPTIMIAPTLDSGNLGQYDFSAIAGMYQMKKSITKAQATNYLASILGTIPGNLKTNANIIVGNWITIFDRYSNTNNVATQPSTANGPKPELGIFDT